MYLITMGKKGHGLEKDQVGGIYERMGEERKRKGEVM